MKPLGVPTGGYRVEEERFRRHDGRRVGVSIHVRICIAMAGRRRLAGPQSPGLESGVLE